MTETQSHYLEQLFYCLEENTRPLMIQDLEAYLTAEDIADSLSMAKEIYPILSNMDDRFLSQSLGQEVSSTYKRANFDFIYVKELFSKLNEFAAMLFIKSLELNFHPSALDNFIQAAEAKTAQSLEIDRLLAEERKGVV